MPPLRWSIALWLLSALAGMAATGRPAEMVWPLLDGEIEGDFSLVKTPTAAPLHWRIAVQTITPNERAAVITVQGPGADLRAEARLDPGGHGIWRLTGARVDLGAWTAALASALGPDFAGLSAEGVVELTPEGSAPGTAGGESRLRWHHGSLNDPAHKLQLEGIEADLSATGWLPPILSGGQQISWTGGRFDAIALGAGRVAITVAGDQVTVTEANLGVFNGVMELGSFSFSFSQPEIAVTAQLRGAEVAQILPLLPPLVAEAHGRVDGLLALKRDATGIQIGTGRLALRSGESAQVRLLPNPGLLSANLPATVKKYYPGLEGIEAGNIPLQADLLEVTFTPEGDAEGRTASVHLAGGPVDPKMRAPVDLTVNVRGPLAWLIKFGSDSRLHFGGGR